MPAKIRSQEVIIANILFAALSILIAAIAYGAPDKQIALKVTGPESQVLAGAKVYQRYFIQDGKQQGGEYTCDENGMVNLAEDKIFKYDWQRKNGVVLYGLFDKNIAGFLDVSTADLKRISANASRKAAADSSIA